jgi:hypothetical protein
MNDKAIDRMQLQSDEFSAAHKLSQALRSLPAIVDDDYPEGRFNYERALRTFLLACIANKRFQPCTPENNAVRKYLESVTTAPPTSAVTVSELRSALQSQAAQLADKLAERERELAKSKRIIEIQKTAIDRWVPCPDHRDKNERGKCYVCALEQAERQLAECRRDAEKWKAWRAVQDRIENELPTGYRITMEMSPGDWSISFSDPNGKDIEIYDFDDTTEFCRKAIDSALQPLAGREAGKA